MAKNVPDSVKKTAKDFFGHFVKRPIKPLGKLFRTQKTDCKNLFFLSELQELEGRSKSGQILCITDPTRMPWESDQTLPFPWVEGVSDSAPGGEQSFQENNRQLKCLTPPK